MDDLAGSIKDLSGSLSGLLQSAINPLGGFNTKRGTYL